MNRPGEDRSSLNNTMGARSSVKSPTSKDYLFFGIPTLKEKIENESPRKFFANKLRKNSLDFSK